ncbi:MAG: DUF2585 family protein [Acidobacteria bacterium]|nr:DUF2585 family protein [Acidobacteriota bacterium]
MPARYRQYASIVVAGIAIMAVTAAVELWMGRLPFGPDGRMGFWEGNIWSSEQSQRFADPYTFSHMIHGMLFYAFLWFVAPTAPVRQRFVCALALEAGWEVLENSPIIIDRYREVTISLGYVGDSVFNSLSDILFAGLGFVIARRARVWVTILVMVAMEVGTALWVRDNLTLNIIMLVHPLDAIKAWQTAGRPLP